MHSAPSQVGLPQLTVAISSRTLFDLTASNAVFETQGLEAYRQYQIDLEETPLEPGDAFLFVKKLLNINKLLDKPRVEVVLLSRNSADTGLRIFNSIRAHDLAITRAAFCGGRSPYRYVKAFGCNLFLSTEPDDASHALAEGIAAATLLGGSAKPGIDDEELRLAFDGDSVIFGDEAERVFQDGGLDAFSDAERAAAETPLHGGPFKPFLAALHHLQQEFPDPASCPIRTALVTARGAPAHERVIRTLRDWDIRLDESLFLGGREKTEFLAAFGADVFFDDQPRNCELANDRVAAGHVPHGVVNEQSSAPTD